MIICEQFCYFPTTPAHVSPISLFWRHPKFLVSLYVEISCACKRDSCLVHPNSVSLPEICLYLFHLNGAKGKQPRGQKSKQLFICVGWDIAQLKKRHTTLEKTVEGRLPVMFSLLFSFACVNVICRLRSGNF